MENSERETQPISKTALVQAADDLIRRLGEVNDD
jgi:hypothetical protein